MGFQEQSRIVFFKMFCKKIVENIDCEIIYALLIH